MFIVPCSAAQYSRGVAQEERELDLPSGVAVVVILTSVQATSDAVGGGIQWSNCSGAVD